MKRLLLTVCSLCAFVSITCAEAWTPKTVPSPKEAGQDYYVANPDGVLQQETVNRLNKGLTQLNHSTYVELAVVAIDAMGDDYYYSAHSFALDLFNYWGIGDKDKNTGVLVFLARKSRDIQIITGDGIAGILTDGICGEILDYNLDYLADDDFDNGLLHICEDIANELMADENRAELLLGWKPKDTETITFWTWYVVVGCLMMILMALCGYKVLNSGKPGEPVKMVQSRADDLRFGVGCLTWIFPIPMLIYYIWHIILRNRLKRKPLFCAQCGQEMRLLDKTDPARQLNKMQQFEEQIETLSYDVWRCPACGATEAKQYKGAKQFQYDRCPSCGAYANKWKSMKVLKAATYESTGERVDYYQCAYCGHENQKKVILRKKVRSSGSSYSGSSWSSGGGSYSSSGSWGGGHSSGGGAGRRF